MTYLETFMKKDSNECIRIGLERDSGLVIRPLSRLGNSMILKPANSINRNLEEAVENFDKRNESSNLTDIITSSDESKQFLERLLREQVHIGNKILQPYALFDVEMFEGTPLFRYAVGIMPEYVHILERNDIEQRVGISEFEGILHRGVHPYSFKGAFGQKPTNYATKLGF